LLLRLIDRKMRQAARTSPLGKGHNSGESHSKTAFYMNKKGEKKINTQTQHLVCKPWFRNQEQIRMKIVICCCKAKNM
jgi:hypothetical protein